MRDGRFYKSWVHIMGSRTGVLNVGTVEHLGQEMLFRGQSLERIP
jgi:hypothetical protein